MSSTHRHRSGKCRTRRSGSRRQSCAKCGDAGILPAPHRATAYSLKPRPLFRSHSSHQRNGDRARPSLAEQNHDGAMEPCPGKPNRRPSRPVWQVEEFRGSPTSHRVPKAPRMAASLSPTNASRSADPGCTGSGGIPLQVGCVQTRVWAPEMPLEFGHLPLVPCGIGNDAQDNARRGASRLFR